MRVMEKWNVPQCPQCHSFYSTRFRAGSSRHENCQLPMLLQCGHGLCYRCFQFARTKNQAILCQVVNCSRPTVLPVAEAIHWHLLGEVLLQDHLAHRRGDEIQFHMPERNPFSSAADLRSPPPPIPPSCPVHGDAASLWCRDGAIVCSRCVIFGDHKGHDVLETVENSTCRRLMDELRRAHTNLCSVTASMEQQKLAVNQKLDRETAQVVGLVLWRRLELQRYIDDQLAEKMRRLRHLQDGLVAAFGQVDSLMHRLSATTIPDGDNSAEAWTELWDAVESSVRTLAPALQVAGRLETTDEPWLHLDHCDPSTAIKSLLEDPRHQLMTVRPAAALDALLDELQDAVGPQVEEAAHRRPPTPTLNVQHQPLESVVAEIGLGQSAQGIALCAFQPRKIYIQVKTHQIDDLWRIHEALQIEGPTTPRINQSAGWPTEGHLVMVLFSHDLRWYRGLVERLDPELGYLIFFVDFGSREWRLLEHLRPLHQRHAQLPAMAVLCALADVHPNSGHRSFSSKCQLYLNENLLNRMVEVRVRQVRAGSIGSVYNAPRDEFLLSVDLYEKRDGGPDLCWNRILIEKNLCQKRFDDPTTDTPPPATLATSAQPLPASLPKAAPVGSPPPPPPPPSSDLGSLPSLEGPPPEAECLFVPPLVSFENVHKERVHLLPTQRGGPALSPTGFYLRTEADEETYQRLQRRLGRVAHLPAVDLRLALALRNLAPDAGGGAGVYAVCWNGGWQRCRLSDDDGAVAQVDLIDVGISAALPADGLHAVDAETASPSRGLARRCRLWGLVPAGGSAWSRAAVEKFALLAAQGSAYFIETYNDSEGVHWVRLYYEFRRAGGPLDCDVVVTECVNDTLCELGLALRRSEPTSPHLRRRDWPSARPLPPAGAVLDADVIWLDEAAELYLHVGIETSVQLAKIGALLDGYFNRSVAQPCDRDAPWTIGEPCIAKRCTDGKWYRCRVQSVDAVAETLTLHYVDYGDCDASVRLENVRRTLLAQTYPVQAVRVRIGRLAPLHRRSAAGFRLSNEHLNELHEAIIDTECKLTVREPHATPVPLVDVQSHDGASTDVTRVLDRILVAESATDASIDDSDDFDVASLASAAGSCGAAPADLDAFPRLRPPAHYLLPVRILRVGRGGLMADIEPDIDVDCSPTGDEAVLEWRTRALTFKRMQRRLQSQAKSFQPLTNIDRGCPCAVYCHGSGRSTEWRRGVLLGYAGDDLLRLVVHLVDVGLDVTAALKEVFQLPLDYLNVSRNVVSVCLEESPTHPLDHYWHRIHPLDRGSFWMSFKPLGSESAASVVARTFRLDPQTKQLVSVF